MGINKQSVAKFKFPKSINSRPIYETLTTRLGKHHLMVADDEGAEAIINLAKKDAKLMSKTHIIFIAKSTGKKYIKVLETLNARQLYIYPSYEAAKSRLQSVLSKSHMGLQVYLAGTESLMGQAMLEATNAGILHTAIQTEHRGSTARRMQCVHCKGFTDNVTIDPFICSHCGLHLFVRDHYSRRLAAFQAVRVDAEDPGNVPKSVNIYP